MRILCNICGSKSVISKVARLSPAVSEAYCDCTNPDCSQRFVTSVSFKHSLTHSEFCRVDMTLALLEKFSPEEWEVITRKLGKDKGLPVSLV